jgi:oxygen-independent coproporphyrinogen-3 oxidase
MNLDECRTFLDAHRDRRQVNRVLHGFPSPRLWQPDAVLRPEAFARHKEWTRQDPAELTLYVGVPFCIRTDPDRCGYCLFPVEVFEGTRQLDTYLDSLAREGEMLRESFAGSVLRSVYIGGGTPNLMKKAQYARMMAIIRDIFPAVDDGVPVTLEGIPQLFNREKLEQIRDSGVGRISMGVQQIDAELNSLSGRRQTRKHTFDAIAHCQELGLACNIDLIFGWPRQTLETMLRDLADAVASGVEHIAHYELNIGGPTDFSLNRRNELPSPATNLEMYRQARDFLVANGYEQLSTYDFQLKGRACGFVYEECERDFGRKEVLGWGFAGVTDLQGPAGEPGCSWVNHRRLADYYAAVEADRPPVERGFNRSGTDLRLHVLFRNLQGMRVDRAGYRARFGLDPLDEHEPVWAAIAERGWARITDDAIALCADGVYHTPLIQELLSTPRLRELRTLAIAS